MLYKKPLFNRLLSVFLLSSIALLSACGDDDPEGPSLDGDYVFVSASLRKDINVDGTPISAGTDISAQISAGLFGAVTCTNPDNTAIRLAAGGTLFFFCAGETAVTPVQAGTWTGINSNTNLVLALSSPPFSTPISATVKGVTLTGTEMSGYITGLPVPGDLFGSTGLYIIDFDIVFEKQ